MVVVWHIENYVTRELFNWALVSEETHVKSLETQLTIVETMGIRTYPVEQT
jgi:bacterioferritin (cytochrome b1)